MPAERHPAQKNRTLPFKPPRPRASGSGSPGEGSSTKATPRTKPTKGKTKQTETDADAEPEPEASSSSKPKPKQKRSSTGTRKNQPQPEDEASEQGSEAEAEGSGSGDDDDENAMPEDPEYILAEVVHGTDRKDVTTSEPTIPGKLLTRLLHHNFQNEKTKVAKDANEVVAKYIDVFVREALARAAYERSEGQGGSARGGIGDGFLEVSLLDLVWFWDVC